MSSIRKVFPIVLSIQLTLTVGITSWISFVAGEGSVRKLTLQLCDSLTYRVTEQIHSYFEDSVKINQALVTALRNGGVNPNNITQVQKDIFDKSRELGINNTFYYGNEQGSFVGLTPQDPSRSKFLLQIRNDSTAPNRSNYELSQNGEQVKLLNNEVYDHRTRPWYVEAKKSRRSIWSSIFVSATDGELTTTKATPIYSAEGALLGVVGLNVSMKQIKQFMLEMRPSKPWNLFLVGENGSLVSSTSDEPIFQKEGNIIKQLEMSKSKDPKLLKVGLMVQEQFGGFNNLKTAQTFEFESNGEKYIVSTRKLSEDLQLNWTVGIIVPKYIFMQEIDNNNRITLIIIVIMLAINILIGLLIASWLLLPIKKLMIAAKEIETDSFDPDGLTKITTRNDELGQMARVIQVMGSTISDRNQGMKSQLKKLREENDKAKKIAMSASSGQNNSLQSILSRSRSARSK